MKEKLIYTNELGRSVEISHSSLFFLEDVEGLGAIKNTIYTQKSPNQDGVTAISDSLEPRDINIEGSINSTSKEDILRYRRTLIQVFNPKLKGKLRYQLGDFVKEVECKVEYAPIFPIVESKFKKFLIQLYCPNPFWKDLNETRTDVSTEVGGFEFPLVIPSEGLELSIRTISFITNLYNPGDVKAPIRVSLKATGTVINPMIENLETGEFIRIKRTLSEGDTLEINTAFGNKRVEVIKLDGTRENVFHYIDYQSKFFSIDNGDTRLKYDAEVGNNNLDVSIYYTPRYLGI